METKIDVIELADGKLGYGPLTPEQLECLVVLCSSPHFRFYQILLERSRQAYVNSLQEMSDPNEMIKTVGRIGGLNIAITTAHNLVRESEAKKAQALKKAEAETAKAPFKRG